VTDELPELHRTEVDGVPAVWADVPGPLRAGLVFRVGFADETLPRHGITHLVEHLAAEAVASERLDAEVDELTTSFTVSGDPGDVAALLRAACDALRELPAERVAVERRVLAAEAAYRGVGLDGLLLHAHFGARGPGLVALDELGLRTADADAARAWARERFARENAALWLSGPPPPGLVLPLATGDHHPPPEVATEPDRSLPGEGAGLPGGVALGALVDVEPEDDAVPSLLMEVLEGDGRERVRARRGLSYGVDGRARRVTANRRLARLVADCRDEDAAAVRDELLATWREAAGGHGLAAARERSLERLRWIASEPDGVRAALRTGAARITFGERPRDFAAVRDRVSAVQEADVTELAERLLDGLAVLSPPGTPPALEPLDPPAGAVEGRTFKPARVPKHVLGRQHLVVGDVGVSAVADEDVGTIRFTAVAAAVAAPGGGLDLIGLNGEVFALDPRDFRDGEQAIAAIDAQIGGELRVPADPRADHVEEVAAGQLKRRWVVGEALDLVWPKLGAEEEVRVLAEASQGPRGGVLAVTDRQLIFVTKVLEERSRTWARGELRDVGGRDAAVAARLRITLRDGTQETFWIGPRGRLKLILEELRRGV